MIVNPVIKRKGSLMTTTAIPRKLNQGMIDALSLSIAKGNYYVTACALNNISEFALYDWLKKSEVDDKGGLTEEESIYIRLAKSLKRAEAQAEAKLVEIIRESAEVKREWLPAITFLERRHPERWGRKDRVQVEQHKRVEISVIVEHYPGEQITEGECVEVPLLENKAT